MEWNGTKGEKENSSSTLFASFSSCLFRINTNTHTRTRSVLRAFQKAVAVCWLPDLL